MQSIFVTGSSSGLGYGISRVLTRHGVRVFGGVRSAADGERLRRELGERYIPIFCDVTDIESVAAAASDVSRALGDQTLWGLVNNAGISIQGPVLYQPFADFHRQVDVNLLGPVRVTQAFLPLLGTDPDRRGTSGKIINISSMSGRLGVPLLTAYTATKYGIEGFSEALRRELRPFGIDVVVLGPGAVESRIWDKATEIDARQYAGTEYEAPMAQFLAVTRRARSKALAPEDVGRYVFHVLTSRRSRVRYAIMRHYWLIELILHVIPSRWLDVAIGKMLHLRPVRSGDDDSKSLMLDDAKLS